LVNAYCAYADTYTTLHYYKYYYSGGGSGYGSDHYYFWERGYRALWGEENDFTPKYHTIGDTIGPPDYVNCGCNNIPQCTQGVKAAVATLAKLAGVRQLVGAAERPTAPVWTVEPNRPNPFVGQTQFRCAVEPGHKAALRIYDNRGAAIRTFAIPHSAFRIPYSVTWDGRDGSGRRAAPGVYFYRLEGDRTSDFGKAVLLAN
jgi:hypothetical protein